MDNRIETFGYSPWIRWGSLAGGIFLLILSLLFLVITLYLTYIIIDPISLLGFSFLAKIPIISWIMLVLTLAFSILFASFGLEALQDWKKMAERYAINESGITVIAPGEALRFLDWAAISRIREHPIKKCFYLYTHQIQKPLRIEYQVQRLGHFVELLYRFTPHLRGKENPFMIFRAHHMDTVGLYAGIFFFGGSGIASFLQFKFLLSIFFIGLSALGVYGLLFKQVRRVEIRPEALKIVRWLGSEDLSWAQIEDISFGDQSGYWSAPTVCVHLFEGRILPLFSFREGAMALYDSINRMLAE